MPRPTNRASQILHTAADVFAGAALGALLTWAHVFLVPNGLPRILAVLLGLSIVMFLQMILCFVLGAAIGSMEAMLPGTIAGMLIMVFPFLPMMSPAKEALAGAGIGASIFLIFTLWDGIAKGAMQPRHSSASGSPKKAMAPHFTISRPPWLYDLLEFAGSRRRAPLQRQLFQKMGNRVLFAAAGTGLNFANFPPERQITAIDLDEEMLRVARRRGGHYDGDLTVAVADLHRLPFPNACFDTVATASTLCSVPDPARALEELRRVLVPGGKLLMFEHVRSQHWLIAVELDFLNWMMRFLGPEMNRNTVALVQQAEFEIDCVRYEYLDVFLSIEAHKPLPDNGAGLPVSPPSLSEKSETRRAYVSA